MQDAQRNLSTMSVMRVSRSTLIDALKKNRATHRDTFLKAQEEYRKDIISELEKSLEDARQGKKIRRSISLPEPEDHTGDYDSAITMLEMCEDDSLMVSNSEFASYVMDDWGWKRNWLNNTEFYASKAAL